MKIGDITYNQGSGKLYKDGSPFLNKIFKNETEAQDYLTKKGLKIRLKKTEISEIIANTGQLRPT
jgi:hypothetical protein